MPSAIKRQVLFRVETPGKITLRLHVLGRRDDGFHNVKIALAPVSLYDSLTCRLKGEDGFSLTVKGRDDPGPVEDNLVYRSAMAFREAWGRPLGGEVQLEKRIPSGAGLGGGSGNGGGVLMAFNREAGNPLPGARLLEMAARLGADVPFFLAPRPSWAEGLGQRLRPLHGLPRLELLIVKPPLSISTAEAYALLEPEPGKQPEPPEDPPMTTVEEVAEALYNRFEEVLIPKFPELGDIKRRLLALGARGALLTGTGSAVFGLFGNAAARDAAAAALSEEALTSGWLLLPCHTLETHSYHPKA